MLTLIHPNSEDLINTQRLSDRVGWFLNSDIHVWSIHRNVYCDHKSYSEYLLDNNEQARAQRFRFKEDHDLFVIGRYITKILMAYYTNISPDKVKIVPDIFGKPVSNMNLCFNISHSGDYILLGFSNTSIGVDIEMENPLTDMENVGKNHFSEREFQTLMESPEDNKLATFFEIWTKKESLIKGIGMGMNLPLSDFNVTDNHGKVFWDLPGMDYYGDWYVREIKEKQGYKSAYSTQNPSADLIHYCLEY